MTKKTIRPTGRGGPGRGQGRHRLDENFETKVVSVRLSELQLIKLRMLGGVQWLRDRIDRARLKTDDEIRAD